MSKHTDLPWTIYRCQFADELGAPGEVACGFNGESLDMSRDECHHPLTMADAELVIKAVNNFQDLLDFVKDIRPFLGYDPEATLNKRADALIAKAEGSLFS